MSEYTWLGVYRGTSWILIEFLLLLWGDVTTSFNRFLRFNEKGDFSLGALRDLLPSPKSSPLTPRQAFCHPLSLHRGLDCATQPCCALGLGIHMQVVLFTQGFAGVDGRLDWIYSQVSRWNTLSTKLAYKNIYFSYCLFFCLCRYIKVI